MVDKNTNIYLGKPRLIESECEPSECEDFPFCKHGKWMFICPSCQSEIQSDNQFGPYECDKCGLEIMVAVEGWVDLRDHGKA